ncbi:helix-turn-helix domain-containing protein [Butyrivibrio sp. LB2008]|uniref:helix-turn-helix domain-containing protein n=1 Tax=Butyrivibrio sp. LB2008 TaxID=1408305 RepID=UPI00047A483F|nr:helix-turn-helix transcriptional regulator [Butyrivibrio sp. LB2008]
MIQKGVNVRLKELRKECQLTQKQIADYLNVDQTLITKYENGTRTMSVTVIDQICNLFGCTEEYLLGRSDSYIPLSFAFRSNGIQGDDLQSIAAVNKIAMNIRYMNEMIGEE